MDAPTVQPLKEAKDLLLVGGKAQSLGNLLRNEFKTLDGFVITTAAFRNMNEELEQKVLNAYDNLQAEYVAVRSSATAEDGKEAAWAGQLDTFLNVSREEIISAIKKCWTAIGSDRAKSYAKAKNIKAGKVAVVVQPMVQCDVAGVAFSAHPVTQDRDQIVIEAGLGNGEAVVSGQITPDTYVVDKKTGKASQKHISNQTQKLVQAKTGKNEWQVITDGNKQKLPDAKIMELAGIVSKIEKFYGFAVDIEWMVKDGVLFIMQARPITSLG